MAYPSNPGKMTKPRSYYVDPDHARYYHVTSRCVRRAWLLGRDPHTAIDVEHRKQLFLNHLKHLSRFFAVEVMGYAIMSNHFHLVLQYDPRENESWSESEVARRWCAAFNGLPLDKRLTGATKLEDFHIKQTLRYHEILASPVHRRHCREVLGSLSRFMQHLKQPFAVWANHEDECTGHFFESRFYSGVLLTENDLLACMAYVDLNPIEAGMARSLNEAENTSIHERLRLNQFDPTQLEAYLAPLWSSGTSEETESKTPLCTLKLYTSQLNIAVVHMSFPDSATSGKVERWMARLMNRTRDRKRRPPAPFYDYA